MYGSVATPARAMRSSQIAVTVLLMKKGGKGSDLRLRLTSLISAELPLKQTHF